MAKTIKKKTLHKKVQENTTVEKGGKVIQEGNPTPVKFCANAVGLSVGVTINLGDYQSLRIDSWLSQEVKEGEDRNAIFNELAQEIQENIEYVNGLFTEEE